MRGTKAKHLRKLAYGAGNAMPRHQHHEYKDLSNNRWGTGGTLLIISARRMYKNLKKGVPVWISEVA